MKLNNKGFAITSIIYSMLILFLTLVVLIIGNLASRKAVFDKQKEDILSNITILPSSYQQVEYIESTGTQYIDTGIIPNQDTGFDIEFLTKNAIIFTPAGGTGGYGAIMGAREGPRVNELQLTTYKEENINTYQGTLRFGTEGFYNAGIAPGEIMRVTLKNKEYTDNNGGKQTLTQEFTSPVTLTVFALNQNGTVTQPGLVQLYSLKIYDGNILVRDFVPCYLKSNEEEIGLYDLVERKFYKNNGTGTFLKCPNI